MNFPENIEEKLGFDKIKELIAAECRSDLSAEQVLKIRFSEKKGIVEKLCGQTREFCQILSSGENYTPFSQIDSIRYLKAMKIAGSFITSHEINDLRVFIESAVLNLAFFRSKNSVYPVLFELVDRHLVNEKLPQIILSKINDKGDVRDDASPELRNIRSSMVALENKARKVVARIIVSSRKEGYTPEDAEVTIRNGRLVIPVKAEYKRQVKGFIHDESASGQTSYIEPAEALELNNEIRELGYKEHREIVKILIAVCDEIRKDYEALLHIYQVSAILDFIRAKAVYSLRIGAVCPEISSKKEISFIKARHPILEKSLAKQQKKIVPLDIFISNEKRILVISGPNAGGKSVTLKTLGLLQYMLQCGLLVPVAEGSSTGIFQKIFIDIGDEQSLENDLSTYSSHLKNMTHFVTHTDKSTLFLIDEFGTGTDPKFGGAIAESILVELLNLGGHGALSTHYSNLKKLADRTDGIANARMRFDVSNLEPLFELEIGKPGSSFALEIARKIGLPTNIVNRARKNAGYDEVQMDTLLTDLEREKNELVKKLESVERKESLLAVSQKSYEDLKSHLEEKKKEILNNARLEAQSIIKTANQKIESAVHFIKTASAASKVIKQQKEEIAEFKERIVIEKPKPTKQLKVVKGPIGKGDKVAIKGQETVGEVLTIFKKTAEVSFGAIKSNVNLDKLVKIDEPKGKPKESKSAYKKLNFDINTTKSNFSSELDIRGKRAGEAQELVREFLDNAIMFSVPTLKVIHGMGNGVLRSVVREELFKSKEVDKVEDEHADRGGSGATIVYLK